jgi:hypothetical protein
VVSGPQALRAAALQSVLRWHYASPAPGTAQVEIQFRLPAEGGDSPEPARLGWAEARTYEPERQERVLEELKAALADPNATPEQKTRWKERLGREMAETKRREAEHGEALERKLKEAHAAAAGQHLSAEQKAEWEQKRQEMTDRLMVDRAAEREAAEHELKELEAALASGSLNEAQQAEMERARVELATTLTRRRVEGEVAERQMKELHKALEDAKTTDEQRARLKRKLEEAEHQLENLIVVRNGEAPISGRLIAIRSERVSPDVLSLLTSRLEVQVGDPIDPETVERIRERVASVDEHFRVLFHADARGGVTLVIVGP